MLVTTASFVSGVAGPPPEGASTRACTVRNVWPGNVTVPNDQVTVWVAESKVPPALAATNWSPLGSVSRTVTFCAAVWPRLSTSIVNVTVSPTFGVATSTDLARKRSACCGSVGVRAELLRSLGSQTSLWVIVAVLKATLDDVARTVSRSSSVWPGLIEGTLQMPPVGNSSNRVPAAGATDTSSTFDGSASVTSTFVAADVPRLKRLTVYTTVSPTSGWTLFVVFFTPRSA